MILRRITEHVKAQNWFAVGLDFLIVVVGVFVGLQVSNWNAERQNSALAENYLKRLESDIELEWANWGSATDYFAATRQFGLAAMDDFLTPANELDEQFLINVYQASQARVVVPNRATFDELLSTGRIVLIKDEELRTAISNHYVRVDTLGIALNTNSQYRRVARLNISHSVQQQIRDNCGDQWLIDDNNFSFLNLPASCEIDISDELLRSEILKLHASDDVKRELGFQLSVLDSHLATLRNTMDTGAATLAKIREAAP